MSELETRELEIRSVEEDGTFEAFAVRYGEVADIGGRFKETFERGAFDGSQDIKVYRDHKEIIGHVLETEDRDEGFWFKAKVALSSLGSDTLALLRSGALSKVSVGFMPVQQRDDNGVIVRTKVSLREISVVERPAYAGASVLTVREESQDPSVPTFKENTVDESTVDPGLVEVREEVQELSRRFDSFTPVKAEVETFDTRSAAEFVKALASNDQATIESYNRSMEHLHSEAQYRAYTGGDSSDAPVKAGWVGDLTDIFDASSGVLSRVFSTGVLPATGNTVEYAQLASNTVTVTEQSNEGDDLDFGKVTLELKTAAVKTYGGYTQLTRQAIERSTLPVLGRSLEAMAVAAGARKKAVLRSAVEAAVTAREGIAANAGVVVLGAVLASATASQWEDALVSAAIMYDGLNANPEALIVDATVFKKLRSLTVSGERVFTVSNGNHSGSLNLPGLTGNLAGIPVYLDAGESTSSAYFVNSQAVRQYDSALVSLQDENIINLSKDFSVYRYGAVAAEKPQLIVPVKLAAS